MVAVQLISAPNSGEGEEGTVAMRKLWKALALAALGALGVVAGASAAHSNWRWPTTTTTVQTTTTAQTTTTVQTTTTAQTTTTVPTTSTGSVQVISPPNGSIWTRGSTVVAVGDVRSETGGVTCVISFGDGTPPSVVAGNQVAPDDYRCGIGHIYLTSGHPTIDIAATGADGTVIGDASTQIWVF
jgi:hypothetical protein